MKPTENIELHVVSQLSHESASSSKGNIEEIATRTEDGIERDGAIADQMSPLNRLGSDSVTDHEDEVLIDKGNILFQPATGRPVSRIKTIFTSVRYN